MIFLLATYLTYNALFQLAIIDIDFKLCLILYRLVALILHCSAPFVMMEIVEMDAQQPQQRYQLISDAPPLLPMELIPPSYVWEPAETCSMIS